jgi:hypothetical protein
MVLPIVKYFQSSLLFVVMIEYNLKLLQILTNDMAVLVRKMEAVLIVDSSEHGKKSLVEYDM